MIKESDGPGYTKTRSWWVRRKDIHDRAGNIYLTRWTILSLFGWALMLHCMRRPDADRCHHDHPWWFITLVLWGGYGEEITIIDKRGKRRRRYRWNRPGTLLYRPALHTHRVADLPKGNCYTLVLRGDYTRVWGFHNESGQWRPWTTFVNWAGTVLWCND